MSFKKWKWLLTLLGFPQQSSRNEEKRVSLMMQFADLPMWAQQAVSANPKDHPLARQKGNEVLSIRDNEVFFNGVRVVHPNEVVEPFEAEVNFFTLSDPVKKQIWKDLGSISAVSSADYNLQINGDLVYFNGRRVVNIR